MRIEINLKIVLILFLFFIFNNINTYIIFIIFVLIHELAHMCVGIAIGGKAKSLTLNPFGISLEFYSYGKDKFLYRILFYFIGPLSNLIIAFIFLNLDSYNFLKKEIIYTNLALCFFNLIPILPLDGGKILREFLKPLVGLDKANRFVIIFSKIVLVTISFVYSILIVEVKNVMILFLLLYLWYLYIIEEKKYYIYKRASDSIKQIIS